MKLTQRMVNNFCACIAASSSHLQQRWTTLSSAENTGIRIALQRSMDSRQPNGVILSAASTIWLPISPQSIFNFFRDERTRPQVHYMVKFLVMIFYNSANWADFEDKSMTLSPAPFS